MLGKRKTFFTFALRFGNEANRKHSTASRAGEEKKKSGKKELAKQKTFATFAGRKRATLASRQHHYKYYTGLRVRPFKRKGHEARATGF